MTYVTLDSGEVVELELRVCAGGCGKTFRCLPSSPALCARAYCAQECHGVALTAAQRRAQRHIRAMPPKLVAGCRGGGAPVALSPVPPATPWPTPPPAPASPREGPFCGRAGQPGGSPPAAPGPAGPTV